MNYIQNLLSNEIKNIIFDLGGVIIKFKPEKMTENLSPEKLEVYQAAFKQILEQGVLNDFEKGLINKSDFRKKVCFAAKEQLSDHEFDKIWNKGLLDYPERNIKILKELSKKYRIFLLSNTNLIHAERFIPQFEQQFGMNFRSLFEKTWLSHEIALRKPDIEVFEYVLKDADIKAEETLFIDDLLENTQAAEKLGIKTFCIKRNAGLHSIFTDETLMLKNF